MALQVAEAAQGFDCGLAASSETLPGSYLSVGGDHARAHHEFQYLAKDAF